MLHHDRHQDGKDGDEEIEHQNAPHLLQVVLAEEAQVEREEHHQDAHEERLARYGGGDGAVVGTAARHFALETAQYTVGMSVDNFAPVDDFLPGEHHAAGNGDAAELVGLLRFAALLVVDDIRHNVLVQVAALQRLPLMGQPLVHEELFVGRHLREEAFHVGVLCRFLVYHAHGARRVAESLPVFRRPHDADLVDLVQPCNDDGDVFVRQSGDAFLKVLLEFVDLLCFCQRIIVVIGLKILVDAVLFSLDGLVGLVDGEVELGYE